MARHLFHLQFIILVLVSATIKAVPDDITPTTVKAVKDNDTKTTVKAVQDTDTPTTVKAVQDTDTPTTVKAVQDDITPTTVKAVQDTDTPTTVKAVQDTETPTTVKAVQDTDTLTTVKAVQDTDTPTTVKAVQDTDTPTTVNAVQDTDTPTTVKDVQDTDTPTTVKDVKDTDTPTTVKAVQDTDTPTTVKAVKDTDTPTTVKAFQDDITPTTVKAIKDDETPTTPDLPSLSLCTTDSVIELFIGLSLKSCIKECERRSLCQSINYNRFNVACILRENSTLPENGTTNAPSICYHITMNNSTSRKSCKGRHCDTKSYCHPNDESPLGYDCQLLYCSSPPGVKNARALSGVPTKVGKNNSYVCNEGYTMFGSATIQCSENAAWSEVEMFCYPNCPSIPEPVGTFVTSWSTYHLSMNTTVIYACSDGYYNLTEPKISCIEHGDWSEFACTPYCELSTLEEELKTISYAELLNVPQGPYNNTAVVTFQCASGYYYQPFGPAPTAQCLTTGYWNVTSFICVPYCDLDDLHVYAGEFESVPQSPYNHTAVVTFQCKSGFYYQPFGPAPSAQCLTTGHWNVTDFVCISYCEHDDLHVDGGKLESVNQLLLNIYATATFMCLDGYYPYESVPTAKCQSTGKWLTSGYCYKYCGAPHDVYWAHIDTQSSEPYTVFSTVRYECDVGGCSDNYGKYCHANGVWYGDVNCCSCLTHKYEKETDSCVWG